MNGKLKWFDQKKGYGFILSEDGKDYFFHIRSTAFKEGEVPKSGVPVEFEIGIGRKGTPEA